MSEKIKSEMISRRRALSLLGLGALSLALPGTLLMVTDAEAQQAVPSSPPPASTPSAPQTGTERRQERRTRRVKRRTARRKGRKERRDVRRTGGDEKK